MYLMDSLWNVGKVKTIKMKRNPEILRALLFAVIGALLIYALYRCIQTTPHYIQEDKTINLNDYLRNVE